MDILQRLQNNWKSGLTVALVSLPLSVSLGVAAGATPLMGVITAIWAGIIAAIFGGSHYNIVGPTGALSGILASFAIVHGVESLPILAIVTGIVILVAYLAKLEKFIVFIPASVVHGFTLGVAFIIALNQFNFALGLQGLPVHAEFIKNVFESFKAIAQIQWSTFALFIVGFIFLLFMAKRFPKIPGAIVLALVGLLLGYVSSIGMLPFQLQTLATKFGEIPSNIANFPNFSWAVLNKELFLTSLTVALVAILETLISAKIADGMTRTKSDQRKEILGLGLGNILSGVMGGIPATAALARTSLNVKAGADHKTSAMISSITVGLIALLFLSTFKFLPLTIIASILVFVAYRMIEAEHFLHLFAHDKVSFALSLFVAVITIAEDPIIGILVGAVIALLIVVKKLSLAHSEVTVSKDGNFVHRIHTNTIKEYEELGDTVIYRFAGQLTYMNGLNHLEVLEHIGSKTKHIILSFRNLFYIDIDGTDVLEEIVEELHRQGKVVSFTSINAAIEPMLADMRSYKKLLQDKMVFSSSHEAVEKLGLLKK